MPPLELWGAGVLLLVFAFTNQYWGGCIHALNQKAFDHATKHHDWLALIFILVYVVLVFAGSAGIYYLGQDYLGDTFFAGAVVALCFLHALERTSEQHLQEASTEKLWQYLRANGFRSGTWPEDYHGFRQAMYKAQRHDSEQDAKRHYREALRVVKRNIRADSQLFTYIDEALDYDEYADR